MINKIQLVLALVLVSGAACSEQTPKVDYKSEAEALCDAFNPATWGVDFERMTPAEKAQMLQNKIQESIHSDEMKKHYKSLITDNTEKAYANYAGNVSDLIGESYTCSFIKDYFSLSFE